MIDVVVCDASVVVAALVDSGPAGTWAARQLGERHLAAPSLLPWEAANVLRRLELVARLQPTEAAQAHQDLLELPIELWPYEALAARCRELRANATAYDAGYVALAELLGTPLLTLDLRLLAVPGVRCEIRSP